MSTISDTAPKGVAGAELVESLKKRLGKVALAGALVPLAVASIPTDAEAGFSRSSRVDGTVTQQGPNEFLYEFEVFNTSPSFYGENTFDQIVNWELPLFSLNGIDVNSITSPEDWTFEVIDIEGNVIINADGDTSGTSPVYNQNPGPYGEYVWDWVKENDPVFTDPTLNPDGQIYGDDPDQFETPALILHWYSEFVFNGNEEGPFGTPIAPIFPDNPFVVGDGSLGGFSFLAADGGTNAPYQASWLDQPPTIGDPPIPQQSSFFAIPNNAQEVPEPSTIALLGAGILGLLGLRRRRKSV